MKLQSVILASLILIFIIILVLIIHIDPNLPDIEPIPLSEYRSKLKTGDVLVTFGNSMKSAIIRTYLQSPATHVGIIIKYHDQLYVMDINFQNWPWQRNTKYNKSKDVRLRMLDHVIEGPYSHHIYGIVPIKEEIKITNDEIKQYSGFVYNCDPTTMFCPLQRKTKYKICSTFVSKIHEDKGIELFKNKNSGTVTPVDYFNSENIIFVDSTL